MASSNHLDQVKKLRKITGVGFNDCNIALSKSGGNIEKSIEYLRIKGISKASKKMERVANDGLICIYEKDNSSSIIEINCETDFVAKNLEFIKFSEEISQLCFQNSGDLNDLKNAKMTDGKTVGDNLIRFISKIGEKINIRRSFFFNYDKCMNFSYVHAPTKKNIGKLGVIVSIESRNFNEKIKDFGHKLAMHIAASNPLAVDVSQLDRNILEKEIKIINEGLKNSDKKKDIQKKISKGKIEQFKQENSLINQVWVMDTKKKVKDVIIDLGKENSLIIKDFIRYKVGE